MPVVRIKWRTSYDANDVRAVIDAQLDIVDTSRWRDWYNECTMKHLRPKRPEFSDLPPEKRQVFAEHLRE